MVLHMSKMIQVRNVSEATHRVLKMRAAAAGVSLSDYVKRDLEDAASRPSLEELDAEIAARGATNLSVKTVLAALDDGRRD
jgi:plasmid stability protein